MKIATAILASLAGLAILTGVYLLDVTFLRYRKDIDQCVENIPADEKAVPENVLRVITKTDQRKFDFHTTTNLFGKISYDRGEKHPNLYYSTYKFIWARILPLYLNENDRTAIGLHLTNFGKEIYGFKNAAQFYFSKSPDQLTDEEILTLFAIAEYPGFVRDPKALTKRVEQLTLKYRANL